MKTTAILALALAGVAAAMDFTPEAINDEVTNLPGLTDQINFRHFSGYLDIPSTVAGQYKHMHYWLVTASEVDPATAPLVYWTNGGPGCSGLLGMLTEQGPFRPMSDMSISINPYAWNRIANMVFFEQPVFVGYSYSTEEGDKRVNDDIAAEDTYNAMQEFYKRFPQFASNDFYVSSESYGGHYVPRFSDFIVEANKKNTAPQIPLVGSLVGNPYATYNSGTPTMLKTLWGHQLVSKQDWSKYETLCLNSEDPKAMQSEECEVLELKLMKVTQKDVNPYALDYPLCVASQEGRWLLRHILPDHLKSALESYEPCEDNYATEYMNLDSVRQALHVNGSITWEECSNTVKYALSNEFLDMTSYYTKLVEDGIKVLVYSGDDDGVCGTEGTQDWIYGLGYRVTDSWKSWKLENGQTAGWITNFDTTKSKNQGKLAFQVVHGAGHEVPTYTPEAAFDLFQNYLTGSVYGN